MTARFLCISRQIWVKGSPLRSISLRSMRPATEKRPSLQSRIASAPLWNSYLIA